ncbi:MAG: AAA family ATPase, partial [Nitrospiria bacterium]
LRLYRGEFLADEPEAMWVSPHREHWRKVHQSVLAGKSDCHVELGQYAAAIQTSQDIIAKDRCHEGAYRRLMLCHYLSGHLNDVVILYRQCCELLKKDLGVDPSEETVRLHEQILRRRVPGIDNTPRSPVTIKRVYRAPHSLGRLEFVGRDHEVGVLASHLQAAVDGQRQVVAIGGEPGIGKTRLAEELLVYARSLSYLTAAGRCYSPALRRPYEPFAEILRQLIKGPGHDILLALNPAWLAQIAKIAPDIPVPKGLPAVPAASPELEKSRFCDAVARALIGLSAVMPLVLLLDDVHWADQDTVDLLHALITHGAHERLCILLTYRSEEDASPGAVWLDLIQRSDRRLTLSQLPDESVLALLRTMTRKGDFSPEMEGLGRRIHHETQGNPLFVVEVLQTLLEQGSLKVSGRGKWALGSSIDPARWGIPTGMRQVMLSRVERLSPEARTGLEVLSPVNRWFTRDLIDAVMEGEGINPTRVLDELLRVGFLQEDLDHVGSYRFVHERVRQSAYDALSSSRQKAAHLRMAQAFETVGSSGATVQELAHHFFRADAWPQAFRYTRDAAEAAQRQYLPAMAASLLDQAEQILTVHGSQFVVGSEAIRLHLHLVKLRERIVREQGQVKKWQKVVAEMVRMARKLGDPVELADAFLALSSLHASSRDWDPAIDLAQQALFLYESRG